jgi:hypothetical protein
MARSSTPKRPEKKASKPPPPAIGRLPKRVGVAIEGSGRGGARAGAGRKRARLPQETLELIGPPPTGSPLAMGRWWQAAGAHLGWLLLRGEVPPKLIDKFRAQAATFIKALPADILHEADKLLRGEDEAREDDAGAELEDIEPGEQLRGG